MYRIVDTVATQNYIKVYTPCENKSNTIQGPRVILPYGRLIQAAHRAEINLIPLLSKRAKTAHPPRIQSGALISIGQPCDYGCTATFNTTPMKVEKKGDIFI